MPKLKLTLLIVWTKYYEFVETIPSNTASIACLKHNWESKNKGFICSWKKKCNGFKLMKQMLSREEIEIYLSLMSLSLVLLSGPIITVKPSDLTSLLGQGCIVQVTFLYKVVKFMSKVSDKIYLIFTNIYHTRYFVYLHICIYIYLNLKRNFGPTLMPCHDIFDLKRKKV